MMEGKETIGDEPVCGILLPGCASLGMTDERSCPVPSIQSLHLFHILKVGEPLTWRAQSAMSLIRPQECVWNTSFRPGRLGP